MRKVDKDNTFSCFATRESARIFHRGKMPKRLLKAFKRPKVLKTSKIRDFVTKGIECQFSKNVGLGKFLPKLEIPEAFVVGLKVSFSGYFVSWRIEDFEVSVSNFVSRVSQSLEFTPGISTNIHMKFCFLTLILVGVT